MKSIQDKEKRTPGEEEFPRRWSLIPEADLDNLGRVHQAGARIVAGSDSGWRQTRSMA
ncbi:hypothetical protein [Amycolatopsis pigmentata]|uniref:Uncharacterized protein n=1 Tax=Amycolatopsis pigmentata TaxID=450801 RepID=A0ABW5G0I7_9PSEU